MGMLMCELYLSQEGQWIWSIRQTGQLLLGHLKILENNRTKMARMKQT